MAKHLITAQANLSEDSEAYVYSDVPHWQTYEYNAPDQQTPSGVSLKEQEDENR